MTCNSCFFASTFCCLQIRESKRDLLCQESRYNGLAPVFLWNCCTSETAPCSIETHISGLITSLGAGWRKYRILLKGSLRWPSPRASGVTAGTPCKGTTAWTAVQQLFLPSGNGLLGITYSWAKTVCTVCQSSGLILTYCFLIVKPQMEDCGTLSWGCYLGSSVFSSESLFTTMSSLDRSKLWLRNPSWGRRCISQTDPSSCLLLFSWEWSLVLSLPAPLLGNCRLQLKQGRDVVH